MLPLLLLRLSMTMRMIAYATSVAKPSAGGLKLDLDHFRREVDDLVRDLKRSPNSSSNRLRPEDDES
jgi:hypothetical protein